MTSIIEGVFVVCAVPGAVLTLPRPPEQPPGIVIMVRDCYGAPLGLAGAAVKPREMEVDRP